MIKRYLVALCFVPLSLLGTAHATTVATGALSIDATDNEEFVCFVTNVSPTKTQSVTIYFMDDDGTVIALVSTDIGPLQSREFLYVPISDVSNWCRVTDVKGRKNIRLNALVRSPGHDTLAVAPGF